jgi:hypothetical protein
MEPGKNEQRHGKIVAVRLPMSLALDIESAAQAELLSTSAYIRRLLYLSVLAEQA